MKRLLLFAAIASCVAWGPVSLGGSTGDCTQKWTMNTSTDSIGTEFIEAGPSVHASCPWAFAASKLQWDSDSGSVCDSTQFFVVRNINLGGINQWICGVTPSRNGTTQGFFLLRADSTTESSEWTQVKMTIGNKTMVWGETGGAFIDLCDLDVALALDEKICAHIYGTGASTTIDFWSSPVGSLPGDWGTPECTVTGTGTNDDGNYHGLYVNTSDEDVSAAWDWDEASGGTCD